MAKKSKINKIIEFTPEQLIMLEMSQDDIANGRLISEDDFAVYTPEWMR